MSDYELTDIDNVGPARADDIADAGFETVPGVAYASVDEFATVTGIAEGMAENIVGSALELVDDEDEPEDSGTDEDATGEDSEQVEEEQGTVSDESWFEFDPTESVGLDEPADGEYLVPIEMDAQVLMHVIHIALEEATKKHQSTSIDYRNDAYRVSRKLMALVSDPDEYVEETISVSQEELSSLYRAISQGSSDYASRSGIPKMWGDFESFKDVVNEQRQLAME